MGLWQNPGIHRCQISKEKTFQEKYFQNWPDPSSKLYIYLYDCGRSLIDNKEGWEETYSGLLTETVNVFSFYISFYISWPITLPSYGLVVKHTITLTEDQSPIVPTWWLKPFGTLIPGDLVPPLLSSDSSWSTDIQANKTPLTIK